MTNCLPSFIYWVNTCFPNISGNVTLHLYCGWPLWWSCRLPAGRYTLYPDKCIVSMTVSQYQMWYLMWTVSSWHDITSQQTKQNRLTCVTCQSLTPDLVFVCPSRREHSSRMRSVDKHRELDEELCSRKTVAYDCELLQLCTPINWRYLGIDNSV